MTYLNACRLTSGRTFKVIINNMETGYFMDRYIDLNEVSDGKLYTSNDLVKAGCSDCQGCSACCRDMADTIVLDPFDIYCLTKGLHKSAADLLYHQIDLGVVDGAVLPHIKAVDSTSRCPFLNGSGRCSIHSFRPGFCRLFPLGRFYENRSFSYFLQTKECRKQNRTKVKVRKWIGLADFERYETFIRDWHYFLKDLQKPLTEGDPQWAKQVNMVILKEFYLSPYDVSQDFYAQFYHRLEGVKASLESI